VKSTASVRDVEENNHWTNNGEKEMHGRVREKYRPSKKSVRTKEEGQIGEPLEKVRVLKNYEWRTLGSTGSCGTPTEDSENECMSTRALQMHVPGGKGGLQTEGREIKRSMGKEERSSGQNGRNSSGGRSGRRYNQERENDRYHF